MELNSNQIAEIIPHRYPFALVDRITDYEPGSYAKGIKCVSTNEMHFLGHFPQHHVMPGVLIIEALAKNGFEFLAVFDDLTSNLPNERSERIYFVTRKF